MSLGTYVGLVPINIVYNVYFRCIYTGCYNWYQSSSILDPALKYHK